MIYRFFETVHTHQHYLVREPKGQKTNFHHHYLTGFFILEQNLNFFVLTQIQVTVIKKIVLLAGFRMFMK